MANIINATQKPALALCLQLHVTISVMPAAACIYRGGGVCVSSALSELAAILFSEGCMKELVQKLDVYLNTPCVLRVGGGEGANIEQTADVFSKGLEKIWEQVRVGAACCQSN